MEQYPIQQSEPVSVKLQGCALALGIIGFVLALVNYIFSVFFNIARVAAMETGEMTLNISSTFLIVLAVILIIICVIAIVLGAVGLVRSIRRPRTVKGIVFSAVGLCMGIGGLVFSIICLFVTGIFSFVTQFAPQYM